VAKRLMCITAHPDDESGAFAGALMQAHAQGAETSVICLTDGRAASNRGDAANEQELGEMRRQEFAAALRVLNADHGEVLDYPDGKLARQDFTEVTAALVDRIRRLRPQVVVTFGGDGNVNLHADHTMVSFFATAAFHWAGRRDFAPERAAGLACYRPQKLYYAAPLFFARLSAGEASEIAVTPYSLVLELGNLKAKKLEAFLEHKSQAAILAQVRDAFSRTGEEERFLLVATRGQRPSMPETNMFDGIEGEE
jgi:LmbE family N-acetylglucosaminyl deacetylase